MSTPFDGCGLWVLDVEHDGNRNASAEEVDVVADLVRRLTVPGAAWIDEDGCAAPAEPRVRKAFAARAQQPASAPVESFEDS